MKRLAAVLALTTLAACGGGGTSRRDVVVYWEFLRHTLVAQQEGGFDVLYDRTDPADGSTGACPQSGVSYVTITDEGGRLVTPETQLDCTIAGVHGATILDIRTGQHTWTVTGYRNDGVATYASTFTFDVTRGGNNTFFVTVEGIRDDVDVFATFANSLGSQTVATSCALAGVQSLAYSVLDGIDTVVAAGEIPCTDPAGLSFRADTNAALDRDDYFLRIQAFASPTATAPLFDSANPFFVPACQGQGFAHLGPQVGLAGVDVVLFDVSRTPGGLPNNSFCQ